jgi:nucleotide-binding universal stress UspA family protein
MENNLDIFPAMVCPAKWDKLMVCTDGSTGGNNAVAVTLELAKACGSKLFVVQVVQVSQEFQSLMPDLRGTLEREVQANYEIIKTEADKMGVDVNLVKLEGQQPHAAIVAEAEKIQPDLVIMGRRGKHRGIATIFMGSVTARVIGHSPENVLVVPGGAALGFQRILVASDGSPYSEAAWKLALAMAKQAASQLIAVVAAPEEGDIIEAKDLVHKLLTAANQVGMPLKGVSPQGVAPDAGIIHLAIKNEVDLIVMGSHGRTGLKRLLMGSVTERVIGQAPCPVLVVKKFGVSSKQ